MPQSDLVRIAGKYPWFSPARLSRQVARTCVIGTFVVVISLSPDAQASPDLSVHMPGPPAIVFRYDDRGPDLVFAEGIQAAGSNGNLLEHAMGLGIGRPSTSYAENDADRSAFVATTAREAVVWRMARGRLRPRLGDATDRRVWIYTIRASRRFFSVERSLQRAMDRMRNCPVTGVLQARLNTLDALINVARGEAEWVGYRYIPPSLIHHATEYRLTEDGRGVEAVPGTRRDNPHFVPGSTHGNTAAWLINMIPRPGQSFLYRSYNEANAAARSLQDRIRNASFGAQFCTAEHASPTPPGRDERASDGPMVSLDAEIDKAIDRMVQKVLAQDLHDLTRPAACTLLPFYDPPKSASPIVGDGSCEAPEKIDLTMVPNGIVWINGQLSQTVVPWASWDLDLGRGNKIRPVFCSIDLGPELDGAVSVMCTSNPFFRKFVVILRGASGEYKINTEMFGETGSKGGVRIDAAQIILHGITPVRPLEDVAHDNPARKERLIQEVFNSGDWGASIVVAPIYTAANLPDAAQWPHEEL